MAHEMGHYVLGHVVRSILLSSLVTLSASSSSIALGRWLIAPLFALAWISTVLPTSPRSPCFSC